MSQAQLEALIATLKDDAGLQQKLNGAADLDAAVAIAQGAGFDVTTDDLANHQASQVLELSDEQLERVAGGYDQAWDSGICGSTDAACEMAEQHGYSPY